MFAPQRPITLLLFHLFNSVTTSIHRPPAPSPDPSRLPSSTSPVTTPFTSSTGESSPEAACTLTTSPSTLVVRFGDPATVNCSRSKMEFTPLGWNAPTPVPEPMVAQYLVWSVDRMTEWSIQLMCYALIDQEGQCQINVPVVVYRPPDNVSISFVNHCGAMVEGHRYSLQCEVQQAAPVELLTVTFYKGQTALARLRSNNTVKEPVTEVFTLDILPKKEDNGVQYWCEAELELGPEGPKHPPVVTSQKFNTSVNFGPHLHCPEKLQVREGESLVCDVGGNPQPSVTWYRDGQAVGLPTYSSRKHAGKYTAQTRGHLGEKNFTVEVEVLVGSGTANSCNRYILSAVVLIQMIYRL